MAQAYPAAGGGAAFSMLSDDVVLNIFMKLDGDPRDWARIACVSARFSGLVNDCCYRLKCFQCNPTLVSDLLSSLPSSAQADPLSSIAAAGGWSALHKLSICCPGLLHAGILLDSSDYGLEREIGPYENYRHGSVQGCSPLPQPSYSSLLSATSNDISHFPSSSCWSLFDDLYFDTQFDASEAPSGLLPVIAGQDAAERVSGDSAYSGLTRAKRFESSHISTDSAWDLSSEQGNKLLARRLRENSLYICNWPGCVHEEDKRKYMLFRGIFKNFKGSRVWRTINDGRRRKIALNCAFCSCRETWDLHSAFCLRPVFGFHDDGEPVVRAFVCENGHVSGAWTEQPLDS